MKSEKPHFWTLEEVHFWYWTVLPMTICITCVLAKQTPQTYHAKMYDVWFIAFYCVFAMLAFPLYFILILALIVYDFVEKAPLYLLGFNFPVVDADRWAPEYAFCSYVLCVAILCVISFRIYKLNSKHLPRNTANPDTTNDCYFDATLLIEGNEPDVTGSLIMDTTSQSPDNSSQQNTTYMDFSSLKEGRWPPSAQNPSETKQLDVTDVDLSSLEVVASSQSENIFLAYLEYKEQTSGRFDEECNPLRCVCDGKNCPYAKWHARDAKRKAENPLGAHEKRRLVNCMNPYCKKRKDKDACNGCRNAPNGRTRRRQWWVPAIRAVKRKAKDQFGAGKKQR